MLESYFCKQFLSRLCFALVFFLTSFHITVLILVCNGYLFSFYVLSRPQINTFAFNFDYDEPRVVVGLLSLGVSGRSSKQRPILYNMHFWQEFGRSSRQQFRKVPLQFVLVLCAPSLIKAIERKRTVICAWSWKTNLLIFFFQTYLDKCAEKNHKA